MSSPKAGSKVVRVDGYDGDRRTVTWRVYLDGQLLGNAYSEDEGYRWIEDMRKMHEPREGRTDG